MTSRTELEVLTTLRSLELTHNLETKHLRKLASLASKLEFAEGEIIYREGDIGEAVYVVEEGQVAIEMNVPGQGYMTILTVGPGELFGWSSLFPTEQKMARARAVKPTWAIAINAGRLQAAWRTDHELETAIIRCAARVMADRIKATRRQLVAALASTQEK